jgi:hypothetical protein
MTSNLSSSIVTIAVQTVPSNWTITPVIILPVLVHRKRERKWAFLVEALFDLIGLVWVHIKRSGTTWTGVLD